MAKKPGLLKSCCGTSVVPEGGGAGPQPPHPCSAAGGLALEEGARPELPMEQSPGGFPTQPSAQGCWEGEDPATRSLVNVPSTRTLVSSSLSALPGCGNGQRRHPPPQV